MAKPGGEMSMIVDACGEPARLLGDRYGAGHFRVGATAVGVAFDRHPVSRVKGVVVDAAWGPDAAPFAAAAGFALLVVAAICPERPIRSAEAVLHIAPMRSRAIQMPAAARAAARVVGAGVWIARRRALCTQASVVALPRCGRAAAAAR